MFFEEFHPAVTEWFAASLGSPTEVQEKAWKEIKSRKNTLIAAPTGSGKTLAAFLAAIDNLIQQGLNGILPDETQIVYVSPLKALSNDIERNLKIPLKGIEEELKKRGLPEVEIRVQVRTGDTPIAERTAMIKKPPHILVTTPESLYLLLTSNSGRNLLAPVHTLIIDEIHALVADKRGSHLSLSLERLQGISEKKILRIGLSATQKPIEKVAGFLTGYGEPCSIVDSGHRRKLELSIEVPRSPLGAVMSNEVWSEIYDRLEELIHQHQTTIIFVNTRRHAERLAHNLSERLGKDVVTAHHGSMSKDHRFDAEQRLKAGKLKALVATASLELGIDIGSVDLVCQMGSPRSIAVFLQRVGRSGHSIYGVPKGIIFPVTRDELVESAAILDAVRRGELDEIIMPEKPVDILAQQIVAEISCREYGEDELFEMMRKAFPYKDLERKEFDEVLQMLSEGFTTRRGRRSAYLHHDMVNGKLRARKGAKLTAIISGGAIPDSFDYDVILEPSGTFIGTLNEDFAIESTAGDIFQLGNSSWKILKVESSKVRVEDAGGQSPTIPFWLGEAPERTPELSWAVARFREEISARIDLAAIKSVFQKSLVLPDGSMMTEEENDEGWKEDAMKWLQEEVGLNKESADQILMYLAAGKAAFGTLPSQEHLVMERFFDEAGDQHVVIHSPFGSRMNRAWGLSLRKRFCRKFNFELQAAATEDAIILSLGSTHSFPLEEVYSYLNPKTVREVLVQALLDAPMFEIRWRWNASRALAILRRRAGQRVPPQIQRMQSEDLIALIFPDQLACLENIVGEREVPQHPLVNQTIHDCLYEAMDIERLEKLLTDIQNKKVELIAADLREASPLAQEILNARPYAFLDDAPLEERRTNAVKNRRWIDPAEAKDLGRLEPEAIREVREEAWPQPENEDEFHDALVLSGFISSQEAKENPVWEHFFNSLKDQHRACVLQTPTHDLWIASERFAQLKNIYPEGKFHPLFSLPEKMRETSETKEKSLQEIIRGRLEILGPVSAESIALSMSLPLAEVNMTLLALENEGFVFRGYFTQESDEQEWCERRLLARIHRYTLQKLRKEIEPVASADFMRFLFSWHHLTPEERPEGPEALQQALAMLEGYEASAVAWEGDILPLRVKNYDHIWLDVLCMSGRNSWGRFSPKTNGTNGSKSGSPIKTTPISIVNRTNLSLWKKLSVVLNKTDTQLSAHAKKIYELLLKNGACFFDQIQEQSGLLKVQVEQAMNELVALGLLSSDSFSGLRALLLPAKFSTEQASGRKRNGIFSMDHAGRWSLLHNIKPDEAVELEKTDLENIARILLKRYGVLFRKLADKESFCPPWRDLVRTLRIMEARGEIRGGRFIEGVWGEQYALPEAISKLRNIRNNPATEQLIAISAADPLNLSGIITPGKRITSFFGNRILYKDGVPVAFKEGKEILFSNNVEEKEKFMLRSALIKRDVSPTLRAYLGKTIY